MPFKEVFKNSISFAYTMTGQKKQLKLRCNIFTISVFNSDTCASYKHQVREKNTTD
jgi:hypothetical protein